MALGLSVILHMVLLFSVWQTGSGGFFAKQSRLQLKMLATIRDQSEPQVTVATAESAYRIEQPESDVSRLKRTVTADAKRKPDPPAPLARTTDPAVPKNAELSTTRSSTTALSGGFLGTGMGPASRVEMEMEIFVGSDRRFGGRAKSTYIASVDQYALKIENAESDSGQGRADWRLDISGRVRDNGLNPETYAGHGELSGRLMGLGGAQRSPRFNGRTPDGLLDKQSLLLQFMHCSPEKNSTIMLSSGGSYLMFDGVHLTDELIELDQLGVLKTRKFVYTSRNGAEQIEVWLLAEQRNLPLRVRHRSADGEVFEQLVKVLRVTP